jgi:hypothetical protein
MPSKSNAAMEIRAFRLALRQLQRSFDRVAPMLVAAERGNGKQQPTRKLRLTPERRAALELQGRYMGFLRGLKPAQKAKVKKTRETKGIRAAIAEARRLAS